jgi:hypothetical protein
MPTVCVLPLPAELATLAGCSGTARRVCVRDAYAQREALKALSYWWDPEERVWWTPLQSPSTVTALQARRARRHAACSPSCAQPQCTRPIARTTAAHAACSAV